MTDKKPDKAPTETQSDKNERAARAPLKTPKPKVLGTATWLGEGEDGPRTNTWNGLTFKVGEPVEITDPHMLAKAKANHFYEVVENDPEPKKGAE